MTTPAYLEIGRKRSFAVAVDWPGWARSGKTPEAALESLWNYRERYAGIMGHLWLPAGEFEVVETVTGDTTTEFGAPGIVPALDRVTPGMSEVERLVTIWNRCWEAFDAVAAAAPETLRRGPRGGGRDTSQIVDHVNGSDAGYSRQIGVGTRGLDTPGVRTAMVDRITGLAGTPEDTRWPVRYLVRRSAWHVLDHLWEIEDKAE
jgi:hypothetical protein